MECRTENKQQKQKKKILTAHTFNRKSFWALCDNPSSSLSSSQAYQYHSHFPVILDSKAHNQARTPKTTPKIRRANHLQIADHIWKREERKQKEDKWRSVQACCCVCLDVSTRISIYMLTYIGIPKTPRPAQKRGKVSSVRTGWISLFERFFYCPTINFFVVDGKRVSGRWLKPRQLPFPWQLLLTALRTADLLPLQASQYLYSGDYTNSWCKERVCGCLRTYSLGTGEGPVMRTFRILGPKFRTRPSPT